MAAILDIVFPPLKNGLVPDWQQRDVVLPIVVVAVLATAMRQTPWRWKASSRAPVTPTEPLSWKTLQAWFLREAPLKGGPDLLGHGAIAERIHQRLVRPDNQAIALIGPMGSGKSSILEAVKTMLRKDGAPFFVVAEFNCWAIPRPEDAPRMALERAIDALDTVIDAQAVRRLPVSYQRILAAEPTGRISRLLGLDDVPDAIDRLRALTPLLQVINGRLLLIIEDVERAGVSFETRHLERLLWTLREVDRVSFVLSFDARAAFDYQKLCDIIERVPLVTASRVEDILAPAYSEWRATRDGYVDPTPERARRDRLGLQNVTNPLLRYSRRRDGDTVADAVKALLTTPRNLKHFVREVDRAWTDLRGEVELDDLIVLTALRHGEPRVFDFIVDNVEIARTEAQRDHRMFEGEGLKTIKARWETVRSTLTKPVEVQRLVDLLDLPQLNSDSIRVGDRTPQGIHNEEPVDYLGRILAGKILPGDIRDQEVIRDIEVWKASRSGPMLEQLQRATDNSDQYVRVWEHYGTRLSVDESIEVASALITGLLETLKADASMEHPAMLAVWRRCRRYMERDTKTDWLIQRIQLALPISLGFATDLFQYWASSSHGIVSPTHRAQVRAAVANSAGAVYQTVDALISSLGPKHEYPLTRLVYPPPSDEPPDTQPLNSWGWLVGLILAAAATREERIVPDVAIMVGDTSSGFRSGNFEDRYKLKRDWMTQIFGDRTRQMLTIFADYKGKNEYALGAKVGALQWLAEPQDPVG